MVQGYPIHQNKHTKLQRIIQIHSKAKSNKKQEK